MILLSTAAGGSLLITVLVILAIIAVALYIFRH